MAGILQLMRPSLTLMCHLGSRNQNTGIAETLAGIDGKTRRGRLTGHQPVEAILHLAAGRIHAWQRQYCVFQPNPGTIGTKSAREMLALLHQGPRPRVPEVTKRRVYHEVFDRP